MEAVHLPLNCAFRFYRSIMNGREVAVPLQTITVINQTVHEHTCVVWLRLAPSSCIVHVTYMEHVSTRVCHVRKTETNGHHLGLSAIRFLANAISTTIKFSHQIGRGLVNIEPRGRYIEDLQAGRPVDVSPTDYIRRSIRGCMRSNK